MRLSTYPGRKDALLNNEYRNGYAHSRRVITILRIGFSLYKSDVKKTQFDLLSGLRRPENRFIIESSG